MLRLGTLLVFAAVLAMGTAVAQARTRDRDRDHDGLSNRYELKHSKTNPRRADTDRDKLKDRYELKASRTNPRRADTDRDTLKDRYELKTSRTDPRRADTDGDGLNDGLEVKRFKTSPRKADTDADGTADGVEVLLATNPLVAKGKKKGQIVDPLPTDPPLPPILDIFPPETTITSGPSGTVASPSATFEFSSSESGSSFECRLDGGAWGSCTAPKAYSGLRDGSHTFRVRATDAAGNTDSTAASRAWTVDAQPADTTPPDTLITGGPSGTSTSSSASFDFTSSESGSTFQCRLDGGSWGSCTSPKAYSGLANGSHTFDVRATDAANNTDGSPASRTWTVDVPPPADTTPPQTSITGGPSGTVPSSSASFDFSSSESGSTFQCRLDGGSWGSCTSPKAYSGLANGSHTFDVRATDAAGNTDATPASRTWTVNVTAPDTTPPDTSITGGPSGTVSSSSASFDFNSSETGSTFQCRLDAGSWGSCTSPKAYSGLANGSHTFDVRATDAAGNTDATPASRTWAVNVTAPDTTPPDTSITGGPSGTVSSSSASFDFSSSESGSTFQCRLDSGAWGSCTSPKSYSGLANGSHTFDVRATDAAGNTDATPASRTWTVNVTAPDTTPPDTSITGGPSGTVSSSSASFDFSSSESGSTFQCRLDSGSWASCSSPKAYSSLADGSHTFDVRATDVAGNTDASPASRSWTVATGGGGGTCTQTLSPGANVGSAVSSAANGSVICLNSGSYGSLSLANVSRSGWVTVRSVSGTGASFSSLSIGNSDFVELESLTIAGGTVNNCSTHIHVLDSTFTKGLLITNNGSSCPSGQDYLIDNSTFDGVGQATYEGRLNFVAVDGGTIQNSTFSGIGSQASDGIQFLGGTKNSTISGNHFTGIRESLCGSVHCDAVQFYGAGANNLIDGNYFEDGDTFIMAPDGTSTTTVTDNVFNGTGVSYVDKIQFGSASSPVFRHNTVRDVRVSFDSKTGSPATTNLIARDNIMIGSSSFKTTNGSGCSSCTISTNLYDDSGSASGSGNVIGTPTFMGGSNPSGYSGYKLASGSVGRSAASDGNDMGALIP